MRIIHSAIALALVPCISEATEYACKLPTGGWESVEAASKAEALHTANQRWPKNKGCALGSAKDQFVTDPRLNRKIINDSYLRPFPHRSALEFEALALICTVVRE